ncbi:MAG: hypothetical protein ACI90G_001477, partial [Urechidicola sp.]
MTTSTNDILSTEDIANDVEIPGDLISLKVPCYSNNSSLIHGLVSAPLYLEAKYLEANTATRVSIAVAVYARINS